MEQSFLPVIFAGIALFVVLLIYFIPGIVAQRRKHKNQAAIIVLNIFLGWTLVGWVAALVWALLKDQDSSSSH